MNECVIDSLQCRLVGLAEENFDFVEMESKTQLAVECPFTREFERKAIKRSHGYNDYVNFRGITASNRSDIDETSARVARERPNGGLGHRPPVEMVGTKPTRKRAAQSL